MKLFKDINLEIFIYRALLLVISLYAIAVHFCAKNYELEIESYKAEIKGSRIISAHCNDIVKIQRDSIEEQNKTYARLVEAFFKLDCSVKEESK